MFVLHYLCHTLLIEYTWLLRCFNSPGFAYLLVKVSTHLCNQGVTHSSSYRRTTAYFRLRRKGLTSLVTLGKGLTSAFGGR